MARLGGLAGDKHAEVYLLEDEFKAAALCKHGLPAVAVGGVNSIRGKDGKLHPDLVRLAEGGRTIIICFDSDAAHEPERYGRDLYSCS